MRKTIGRSRAALAGVMAAALLATVGAAVSFARPSKAPSGSYGTVRTAPPTTAERD
ncbi:MAG TPA: hypothetical protein VEG38_15420 [Acidimicrobiia bacterium]|nr:hypothetical protein [Acidimicrobiia bacterium]